MLTYWSLAALKWMCARASRPTRYKVASLLCDFQYVVSWRKRARVKDNVTKVLLALGRAKEEATPITRTIFRNFGRYLADFLSLPIYSNDEIRRWIGSDDLSFLDELRSSGKGAILVSCHVGNWELGVMAVALHGHSVTAIAQAHKNKKLNDLFKEIRHERGVSCVGLGAGIRECVKALRRNEMVAIAGDWITAGKGVAVDFFGRTVQFPQGPARLSIAADVPVIPGVMAYDEMGRPYLKTGEVIWPPKEGSKEEKLSIISKRLAQNLERWIGQHLDQWCMFHRIWPN